MFNSTIWPVIGNGRYLREGDDWCRRIAAIGITTVDVAGWGKADIRGSTNPITSNEVALDSWLCRRRSLSRPSTGIRCPGISDGKSGLTQTFDTALIVFWIPERKNAAAAFDGEFRVDPERFCPSPSGLVRPAKVAVA